MKSVNLQDYLYRDTKPSVSSKLEMRWNSKAEELFLRMLRGVFD